MTETHILSFLLVLTRVSVFVGFFTLFSFRQLPHLVKVGVAVGLSIFWFGQDIGTTGSIELAQIGLFDGALLFGKEVVIGIMLTVAMNLFFMPCKIAGAYVGQEMGLSLASISSPGTPDSGTLVTRILEAFTVLVFFALNLHHFLLLTMDYSFRQLGGKIDILNLPTEQLAIMLNQTSEYGLIIVAPIGIILAIVTVALSVLNRVAPAMNLFSIGFSVRAGLGIFCLAMLLPVIFGGIRGYLYRTQMDIEELLMLFQLN